MTRPELLEHLDGLRRVKDFPTDEESAVQVVVRFYADRGVLMDVFACTSCNAVPERITETVGGML